MNIGGEPKEKFSQPVAVEGEPSARENIAQKIIGLSQGR
jgi:hypothetical protein